MEIQGHQKTKTKMAVVNPRISIIILNVNGQNTPIKMQSIVGGWRGNTQLYATFRRPTSATKTNRLKVKGWKMIL